MSDPIPLPAYFNLISSSSSSERKIVLFLLSFFFPHRSGSEADYRQKRKLELWQGWEKRRKLRYLVYSIVTLLTLNFHAGFIDSMVQFTGFGFSHNFIEFIQGDSGGRVPRFVDLDLGKSPDWWAATVATYCPSRMGEYPKSKSTQPRYSTTRVTLYIDITIHCRIADSRR